MALCYGRPAPRGRIVRRHYPDIALGVPSLLLPREGIPLGSWSVIACDQYTSQPEYWQETRRLVGDNPSTLDLVLPEAHLAVDDLVGVISRINGNMSSYLERGVFAEQPPGLMLVERDVGRPSPRRGLVAALDLEHFDFSEGARVLIRSTEGTDPTRLPVRMAVRRHAVLETPHILVLIDDPECTVIDPLFDCGLPLTYDFELMQGGGRVRGWHIGDGGLIDAIAGCLKRLRRGEPPMLYAMGDGNHSFAAARAVWDEIKASEGAAMDHPARHALVELVNIHDAALEFAPIHRLVDGVPPDALFAAMAAHFGEPGFSRESFAEADAWRHACRESGPGGHTIPYLTATETGVVRIDKPGARLETASLHGFLDPFLDRHDDASVDYIHGDHVLEDLAKTEGRVGFLLPVMDKNDLFRAVVEEGATPRKTFSLGEADEKRFYLECRRIRP